MLSAKGHESLLLQTFNGSPFLLALWWAAKYAMAMADIDSCMRGAFPGLPSLLIDMCLCLRCKNVQRTSSTNNIIFLGAHLGGDLVPAVPHLPAFSIVRLVVRCHDSKFDKMWGLRDVPLCLQETILKHYLSVQPSSEHLVEKCMR